MSDKDAQGIQTASDVLALVERTKAGWEHRANVIDDMESRDMAGLAAFIEELIMINTVQLKTMALLWEQFAPNKRGKG